MNNEIEQIAQQNDMSIEFVRWFINEKKADCGEHWFLALGAMWEGWKAREGEATALALTLEKSREASGCPAGVDLQDWVKQLAAENATMKSNAIKARQVIMSSKFDYWSDRVELFEVVRLIIETPATERIVTGIKADGVEMFVEKCREESMRAISSDIRNNWWLAGEHAEDFAAKLREGADK